MNHQEMMKLLEAQSLEFDTGERLAKALDRCVRTPVVDDDYPAMRHEYESALRIFLHALADNNRFDNIDGELKEKITQQINPPSDEPLPLLIFAPSRVHAAKYAEGYGAKSTQWKFAENLESIKGIDPRRVRTVLLPNLDQHCSSFEAFQQWRVYCQRYGIVI